MRLGVTIGMSIAVAASASSIATYYTSGPPGQLISRIAFQVIVVASMYLVYNSMHQYIMKLARQCKRDRWPKEQYKLLLTMLLNIGGATILDWMLPTGQYRTSRLWGNVWIAILAIPYTGLMWRVMCWSCAQGLLKASEQPESPVREYRP